MLSSITETPSTFREILSRMGISSAPTPEHRETIRSLIANGQVVQTGIKRGAKYSLSTGTAKPTPVPATVPKVVVAPTPEPELVETPELTAPELTAPESVPALDPAPESRSLGPWVRSSAAHQAKSTETWLDPQTHPVVTWEVQEGPAHTWILDRWATLGEPSDFILELGLRISQLPDCPYSMLAICNAICDLTQVGKLPAKRVLSTDGTIPRVKYGTWPDHPSLQT